MKPKIFVGSSNEAVGQARIIADTIGTIYADVIVWNDFFQPGDIVLDALEQGAPWFAGAVLLARPDDRAVIRTKPVTIPRTNVMLELGLFAAILGRKKIALCAYEGAVLPSDLTGYTYIHMGRYPTKKFEKQIDGKALVKLQSWLEKLECLTEGIPYNKVVHGYSGKWRVNMDFDIWGGISIVSPDFVVVEAGMVLHIPRDGSDGYGSIWGEASIQIDDCHIEFRLMEEIMSVHSNRDASVSFKSRSRARQRTRFSPEVRDNPKLKDNPLLEQERPGPHIVDWELKPHPSQPRKLIGEHFSGIRRDKRLLRSHASIEALKID